MSDIAILIILGIIIWKLSPTLVRVVFGVGEIAVPIIADQAEKHSSVKWFLLFLPIMIVLSWFVCGWLTSPVLH